MALLEDLLLQALLVTRSLFVKVAQVSGCGCSDRVEGHSRLISSRVDGCSPWVSGLSVYRFLELHRGIQLKCKIMPFHPLLLFIILKGQESSCSGFIPVELYYFRALLSALLFGEARCFLKNTKL